MAMFYLIVVFIFALCIGSFLNVVIYRFPIMLTQQWHAECLQFLGKTADEAPETLTLAQPRSRCPYCQQQIPFWHNIPLVSFILLRGKCANCQHAISWRYFIVELLTGFSAIYVVYHFGVSWQAAGALIFTWFLIALIFIDLEHQLLPDEITLSLLWLGVLWNLFHHFTTLQHAVIGAVSGYVFMWSIAWIFRKVRNIEGLGYGDFKLTAALGAWLGWQLLPLVIMLAAGTGAISGIAQILIRKQSRTTPIPFGPYLAIAGWIALFWGQALMTYYWQLAL